MNNPSDSAVTPRPGLLRIRSEQCLGHARCREFLPELLAQDERGLVQLKGNGAVPPSLLERAKVAAACCPEMAIELLQE